MFLPELTQRIKSVSAKLLCPLEERTDFLSQCVNVNTSLAQESPKDAIAARRNLNPALAEKLKEAFLSIKDQDMRYSVFMKNTSINGFIEAQDAAYDILRKASNTL